MAFAIRSGQRIVFTGDSITDCGRRAANRPLGDGYVRMVRDLIAARYPARQVTCINTGIGSETIRDIAGRLEPDVIAHDPDWVSIGAGVNDAWCHIIQRPGKAVSPEEYSRIYSDVITTVQRRAKAKVVLIEPFYISHEEASSPGDRGRMMALLPTYQRIVAQLARRHRARLVPAHRMFAEQLRHQPADALAPEAVHPHSSGHLMMAYAWLRVVGW